MTQKDIGTNWDRDNRNAIQGNFNELFDSFTRVVEVVSEKAYGDVIDAAKLEWKDPVDTQDNLPSNSEVGDTRMVRDSGKVYRFNGEEWKEIQQIDASPVNEVDSRLSAKINEGLNSVNQRLSQTDNKLGLDNWELQNKTRVKKPIVTFIDDDGREDVLIKLKPLSEQYGVPFTSTVYVKAVEDGFPRYMSPDDLIHLQNDLGWEISSHTYNHPNLSTLSDEEQEFELRHSKEVLESWGLDVNTICYPFDGRNDKTYELARKYYRAGRRTGGGINAIPIESFEMRSVPLGSWFDFQGANPYPTDSLEYYKYRVDQAIESGGWVIFMTHVADPNHDEIQQQFLEDIIQYIQSLGVDIVTFNEGLNRVGNIVDTGHFSRESSHHKHFVIGADGSLDATDVHDLTRRTSADEYTVNSKPSDFPMSRIHHTRISAVESGGFPLGGSGLLITDTSVAVPALKGLVYQIYHIYRDGRVFKRVGTEDDEWTVWEDYNSKFYMLEIDEVNNSTESTYFAPHKISVCRISTVSATGFPLNRSGVLTTNRLNVNPSGYTTQEYDIYNSHRKFRRNENLDGTWGEWKEYSFV